jgi:N-lysine methyltransferase SETD6
LQILHTYGDLSDAALLQTYGFVDDGSKPPPRCALAAALLPAGGLETAGGGSNASTRAEAKGGAGRRKRKASSTAAASEGNGPSSGASGEAAAGVTPDEGSWAKPFQHNPHNSALVPLSVMLDASSKVLQKAYKLKVRSAWVASWR